MKVKLLTTEQKDLLVGIEISDSHFYNPFLDADRNQILSLEEANATTNPDYLWVKDLPEIDYNGIPFDIAQFNLVNNN